MFQNVVAVSNEMHGAKKLKKVESFDFASNFHIASVMVHEFGRAATIFPVVFLEDPRTDGFRPVVLLGLEADKNLFVKQDGSWAASYVPAILRRYPFTLAKTEEDGNRYAICVDSDSELLSDSDGQPLFNDDGTPSSTMENVKNFLGELQQMEIISEAFTKKLAELNLFTPLNMSVRDNANVKNITGCYVINEERLKSLSDEKFLELRKLNYLAPIFAHLTSLAQVERLVQLAQGKDSITAEEAVQSDQVH
ncbi:MAG: SapC family protein [Gammaproteobacteria bacterium]|nr:SapC family protein [Gammaproteobacteria bacterium]